MRVVVFGPNLSSAAQQKGYMHVHAEGCEDCRKYGPGKLFGGEDHGWAIVVATRKEVVTAIYSPDDFEYDADTEWRDYDDLFVAPCVQFVAVTA